MKDSWQPSASIDVLKKRAFLLRKLRHFFEQKNFLEVETPVMSSYGITDVYLSNIKAIFREKTYFLQTSPEYHMKRLLAAGSGSIFQIARVFRDDEYGRWHNPEFTLLEWYHLNTNLDELMDELDTLLHVILLTPPMLRKTYQMVFKEICHFDPFDIHVDALQIYLQKIGLGNVLSPEEKDIDQYLFLLMSHVIEPHLSQLPMPVAIYHFPPSQAALAKINAGVAERVEVYFKGIELANGFHELTDASQQAERFALDNKLRQSRNIPVAEPDVNLLQALRKGLPACSGAALGVDRLLALWLNLTELSAGISFAFDRA